MAMATRLARQRAGASCTAALLHSRAAVPQPATASSAVSATVASCLTPARTRSQHKRARVEAEAAAVSSPSSDHNRGGGATKRSRRDFIQPAGEGAPVLDSAVSQPGDTSETSAEKARQPQTPSGRSDGEEPKAATGSGTRSTASFLASAAPPSSPAATLATPAPTGSSASPRRASSTSAQPGRRSSSSSSKVVANPAWLPHAAHHDQQPRLLLLGSMTCEKGVSARQYYAHPQNHFWRIMGGVLGRGAAEYAAQPYAERIDVLLRQGVCLWNVLAQCERKGSLDAAIRAPVANDIASVLRRWPSITTIGCNGQWSYNYLRKHVALQQPELQQRIDAGTLRVVSLVSSSPACAMPNAVQTKTQRWTQALSLQF